MSLTVLISSVVLGLAGYWLFPDQAKGAIVGAGVGAAGAASHVQQEKRLRQIASKQSQLSSRQHQISESQQDSENRNNQRFDTLTEIVIQTGKTIEGIAGSTREHSDKISRLEKPTHTPRLESRTQAREDSQTWQRLQQRLETLEHQINTLGQPPRSLGSSRPDSIATKLPQSEPEVAESEAEQKIFDWFKSRKVTIESYYEPDPIVDKHLDGLSFYLGEHYSLLRELHQLLRQNPGRNIRLDLEKYQDREKNIHLQYIKKLLTCDFLSKGRKTIYKNNDKITERIDAAPYDRPHVRRFFDGEWFEKFIFYKIADLFKSEGIEYQYIRNPKIVYSDGEKAELDLFFLVNQKPLLVECKSGRNYTEGIERFFEHRRRLSLSPKDAIFVVLDINDQEAHLRTINWKLTVADQNQFLDHLQQVFPPEDVLMANISEPLKNAQILENPLPANASDTPETRQDSVQLLVSLTEQDNLGSFFRSRGLNQAPEFRNIIFTELIKVIETLSGATSFSQIEKTIRDNLQSSVSLGRGKIHEVLNCLLNTNLFRDREQKPVRILSQVTITHLTSTDIKVLEEKCMEFYAQKIMQLFDPDFFDVKENLDEFERLTLGHVPSQSTIQDIKQKS
ncbi:DUF1887 family protein [Synechococcales cyanobacterium C]|uniref:DUF1887 family protein n=1 Tax=Petrachloros mirabilis ULC683 TaxID=2781853 RepID=A0A8K2A2V6_9CYAN|nr:DUF1887 family protein [Petrachloros mirabilis]NCJ08702.1 DUF1887 family protein [Petrachloros mirabilis ULC683]